MANQTLPDNLDAQMLFPDLMGSAVAKKTASTQPRLLTKKKKSLELGKNDQKISPPQPPDISWLKNSRYEDPDQGYVTDIPLSLVLIEEPGLYDKVAGSISNLGYQVEGATSVIEALDKLVSFNYSTVVLHAGFGGENLRLSTIHSHLLKLPMEQRRLIYYILIGPDLNTCYDLEALSLSANLVVNEEHVPQMNHILKKGFREYEELFGPLVDLLGYV